MRVWGRSDLDKCPKSNKIASSRVRVWGYKKFPFGKNLHRLLARAGVGALPQISEGTRRLPGEVLQGSRSGVGLVPVAVNDYSPQKGRCGSGAGPVTGLHADRQTAGGVAPGPGPDHMPVTCLPGEVIQDPVTSRQYCRNVSRGSGRVEP